MEDKKSYLQKLAAQLREWDTEIEELKVKAEKVTAEAHTEILRQIEELRAKKEVVQNKLQQLQEVGDDAWEDIKVGVERSWTELKGAFRSAFAKLMPPDQEDKA
ncbi:MAG: coiled coil domain-containing protein [candidate division KSB1 bacterium]|nr:coiled coil domain-containing protein [candidate division KSB1 bacterium]MDZ7300875.1 coiled coil domain-containing protein [candidate division KSB1 bacterium]MDZ7309855.1 coiled coil domain-containing protein [candidate division KSB1 bacterium]